jgi:hypothetical protein
MANTFENITLWQNKNFAAAHRSDVVVLEYGDNVNQTFKIPMENFWYEQSSKIQAELWNYTETDNPQIVRVLANPADFTVSSSRSYYEATLDCTFAPKANERIHVTSTIAVSEPVQVTGKTVGMNVTWDTTAMNGFLQWQVSADKVHWEGWQDINNGTTTTLNTFFGGGYFNALTPNNDFPWPYVRIVYDGGGTINGTDTLTTQGGTMSAELIIKGDR